MQNNSAEHAVLQAATGGALANHRARGVALSLNNLSKRYGERHVLQAVDLQIAAGEFVVVIGRSGCGKSTLLRLVAGLEQPTTGAVRVAAPAHDGAADPGLDSMVRIMFQEARLLPWKSVLGNVALGLTPGSPAPLRALQQVGLESRAADWPAVLSGGQRQRVALARALVHAPALLLLDEPLGALDALTRIEMQRLIEQCWKAQGFTALLVTHDVQEAIALADRVLLIEEGGITLDLRIDLPRPRRRGDPRFAELEERLLSRVLGPGSIG